MMERLYVGTYTGGRAEDGIYTVEADLAGSGIFTVERTGCTPDPSFLTMGGGCLYAASEQAECARADAYRILPDGCLTWLGKAESRGSCTCHVSLRPGGGFLFAADYMSGTVWSIRLNPDGSLDDVCDRRVHRGHGPNPIRQSEAHAHSMTPFPDGRRVLAADLGMDQLVIYTVDTDGRLQTMEPSVCVPAGAGPRHFVFSGDGSRGYLITEMGNEVIAYRCGPKGFEEQGRYAILPESFSGESIAADIHFTADEHWLYASSRGWDGIVCFRVLDDGSLSCEGRYPCGGRGPRNFCISPDGRWLAVANQISGTLVFLPRDVQTGALGTPAHILDIPQAVCVLWI